MALACLGLGCVPVGSKGTMSHMTSSFLFVLCFAVCNFAYVHALVCACVRIVLVSVFPYVTLWSYNPVSFHVRFRNLFMKRERVEDLRCLVSDPNGSLNGG